MGVKKIRKSKTTKSTPASTTDNSGVQLEQSEGDLHWADNGGSESIPATVGSATKPKFGIDSNKTQFSISDNKPTRFDLRCRRNQSQGRGNNSGDGRQVNSMVSSVSSVPKTAIKPGHLLSINNPSVPQQIVLDGFNRAHSTEPESRNRLNRLLIDDIDQQDIPQTQQLDKDIFALYGALPNFTDPQKRLMFSKTEDRIPVHSIYLGIYRFGSTSGSGNITTTTNTTSSTASIAGARPLYLRVDGSTNQCILLGLNRDSDDGNRLGTEPVEVEQIPFHQVINIGYGSLPDSYGTMWYIAFEVEKSLTLRSVGVGYGCMLYPTRRTSENNSAKYILVLIDEPGLQNFRRNMSSANLLNNPNRPPVLFVRDDWIELEADILFAHNTRDQYQIEYLRTRAARERRFRERALPATVQEPTARPRASTAATQVVQGVQNEQFARQAPALHAKQTVPVLQPAALLSPAPPPPQAPLPASTLDPNTKRDRDIVQIQNTLRDSAAFGLSKTDVKRLKDRLVALLMVE